MKYSKVSSLLEDARSFVGFSGTVELAGDLKIIPIIGSVELEKTSTKKKT